MAEPITVKCAAAAGCITSFASLFEYFAWYVPALIWAMSAAGFVVLFVPMKEQMSPLKKIAYVLFSGFLGAGATAFFADKLGIQQLSTESVVAIGLGAVVPVMKTLFVRTSAVI